ncbi:MAG: proteasome accessory factor PafA2 family protein [Myxococcota bacterium]
MLQRLLGQETEYAIRFTPRDRSRRPSNEVVYNALSAAVSSLVSTRPGERQAVRKQFFTENGGAFCYEFFPYATDAGLMEGATPECRGPGQLLLYQRAQEALLLQAIPIAEQTLAMQGYGGSLGLIKNCRDAQGHVYGAQENYEVEIARGVGLWLYRAGLVLLMPLLALTVMQMWMGVALFLVAAVAVLLSSVVLSTVIPPLRRVPLIRQLRDGDDDLASDPTLGRLSCLVERVLGWPVMAPFALLLRALAFRRVRRDVLAFLVSRPIISGTGTVMPDGSFWLSEKGVATLRVMRSSVSPADRPILDTGNLFKDLAAPVLARVPPLFSLFSRRQRLQLGLSDSNRAQVAEYLKVGTTSLVLDMMQAGALADAPRFRDPVAALKTFISDATLRATVRTTGNREVTALQVQRYYLERARAFVRSSTTTSLEAHEIVRHWGQALDALEQDPGTLVGKIDWVTKRHLLQTLGRDSPHESLKKMDLRYHELGVGYLDRLERAGQAPRLVDEEQVQEAVRTPPSGTPARLRSRLIRMLPNPDSMVTVSWSSVRVGGPVGGQVIRLDDHRPCP